MHEEMKVDGGRFAGMRVVLLSSHHAPDGSAVGVTWTSDDSETVHLLLPAMLIDVLPEVFSQMAAKSQAKRPARES